MYPTRWRQLSKQSTDNKGLLCCLNLGNVRIISWRRESRREAGGGDQEQAEGLLLGCAFASLPSFFNMVFAFFHFICSCLDVCSLLLFPLLLCVFKTLPCFFIPVLSYYLAAFMYLLSCLNIYFFVS